MPRFKNATVDLPEVNANNTRDSASIQSGLLMDLRDELQEQNRHARETNRLLARIDRRLQKHLPLR